jgi:hypothetical protein
VTTLDVSIVAGAVGVSPMLANTKSARPAERRSTSHA